MDQSKPSELQIKIARNVVSLVQRRQFSVGQHVTEKVLIEEFGVSRAPVRAALSYLESMDLMEYRPDRGYFVRKETLEAPINQLGIFETKDEEVLVQLARDVMMGRIGEKFTQAEFRRLYDLGRLASSRVLLQMADEGVVSRGKGSWWYVEPTLNNQKSFDESLDFRMFVEPAAILCPTFKLDEELAEASKQRHLRQLEPQSSAHSAHSLVELDADFHMLIAISSRNRFFEQAIARQNSLRKLVEFEGLHATQRLVESCGEHVAMIEALQAGERQRAAELMRQHLLIVRKFAPKYSDGPAK